MYYDCVQGVTTWFPPCTRLVHCDLQGKPCGDYAWSGQGTVDSAVHGPTWLQGGPSKAWQVYSKKYESVSLETSCIGSWFTTPRKEQKLGKTFVQTFISSRDGPEKVQKQAEMKNARNLLYALYICYAFLQMYRVVFLHSFIFALIVSVLFSGPSLLEVKFCRNISSLVYMYECWTVVS